MLNYAKKYNNTSFWEMPFNIIDGLILSQLSYYDYSGTNFEKRVFTGTVGECLREKDTKDFVHGMLNVRGDEELIQIVREGSRFGDLKAAGYIDESSEEYERQFAAVTFALGNDEFYIAFRGTDNSVVGWKEDFNLSYQKEISSQKLATLYAMKVMELLPGKYYFGGHSKGGNLAAYAAIMIPDEYKDRLLGVFDFDGPGFTEEVYGSDQYKKVKPLIHKVIPQMSVVGLMMERDNHYKVVRCDADISEQHSPFYWKIIETDFEWVEKVDEISEFIMHALNTWIQELDLEERKVFGDTIFGFITDLGITNFDKTYKKRKGKFKTLINRLRTADKENQRFTLACIGRLFKITAAEIREARAEGIRFVR